MITLRNEEGYLEAMRLIRNNGVDKLDRTGVGTRSIFGAINVEYDLVRDGKNVVPLPTTKKVNFDNILHELIWMMSGSSSIRYLKQHGVNIWDSWVVPGTEKYQMLTHADRIRKLKPHEFEDFQDVAADMRADGRTQMFILNSQEKYLDNVGVPRQVLVDGDLGPVYGKQWRDWVDSRNIEAESYERDKAKYDKMGFKELGRFGIDHEVTIVALRRTLDQIRIIENQLQHNKDSRRIILSAWNVSHIEEMALPPCHTLAQWAVEDGELSCKLYQRSGDIFLGVPYNAVFYSTLTHLLAHTFGLEPGKLFHSFGDAHIYTNHKDQVEEQLSRNVYTDVRPELRINCIRDSVVDYKAEDFAVHGYIHQAFISAPVAV